MLHNALRYIVKPPKSACADSRNEPQCCRMCRNESAWRSYLDSVASQQQARKQGPQLVLSAWRNGTMAPMHHRSYSGLGMDRRRFGRSSVVKRGEAACWRGFRAGQGSKGLGPTLQQCRTPRHTFAKFFAAQKNLGFAPLPRCPRIGGKAVRLRFLDAG